MKTILVVEDDTLVRMFEVAALNRAGYRVIEADDGVKGASLFARDYASIDLLLTDISMPGMRGPDLARFARSIQSHISVLFASGSIVLEDVDPLQIVPGSEVLEKPFTTEDLLTRVAAMLEKQLLAPVETPDPLSCGSFP